MRQLLVRITFLAFTFAGTAFSIAQDTGVENDAESMYDKMDQQNDQVEKAQTTEEKKTQEASKESSQEAKPTPKPSLPEAQTITDLAQLQPFTDIAVIEKRFLPKTNRFEISAVGFTGLNNPFFNNFGGSGKAVYYLTEQWGIELIGTGLAIVSRQVTDDLNKKNNISTSNVVTPRSFFGGGVKWNPVYGKISFLNHAIVPFDINFSAGGGLTQTDQGRSEPTIHLGTSQIFAVTKEFGVRWDIDWNFYQAQATDINSQKVTVFHNDLFIGIGVSVYFPEATYR